MSGKRGVRMRCLGCLDPWWIRVLLSILSYFILSYLESRWQINKRMDVESWDVLRLYNCWTFDTKNGCSDPQRQNVPYQTKGQNFFGDDSDRIHFWSPLLISQVSVVEFLVHLKFHSSEAHGPISKCELILFWSFSVCPQNKPKYHSISVSVQSSFPIRRDFLDSKSTSHQGLCLRTVWRRWLLHAATHQPGKESARDSDVSIGQWDVFGL